MEIFSLPYTFENAALAARKGVTKQRIHIQMFRSL